LVFEDVIGQDHVITTLKNAILENRIAHAYLFTGPHGIGKTTIARIFAKAINCIKGPTVTPCNKCEICLSISRGEDCDVIEIDAASNRGVDETRNLREGVQYMPLRSRCKIYIMDESHMLTPEASNTLLKTLEEPPPFVKFFFATTAPQKMLETILSRCQRFDLRPLQTESIKKRLTEIAEKEGIKINEDCINTISRFAGGSLRDAETILDQLNSYKNGEITLKDLEFVLGLPPRDTIAKLLDDIKLSPQRALEGINDIFSQGIDGLSFVREFISYIRDLLVFKICEREPKLLSGLSENDVEIFQRQKESFSENTLLYFTGILFELHKKIKEGIDPRIACETIAVKMALCGDIPKIMDILKMLENKGSENIQNAELNTTTPEMLDSADSKEKIIREIPTLPPSLQEKMPDTKDEPTVEFIATNEVEEDGIITVDYVKANWQRVLTELRSKKITVSAMLGEGKVKSLEGNEIIIELPRGYDFHKSQLEQAQNKRLIESVIESVLGKTLSIHPELEENPTTESVHSPSEIPLDSNIRKILDFFGGKIVSVKEKD
jgi:DNA polymerase-3 subunit gamma/tau